MKEKTSKSITNIVPPLIFTWKSYMCGSLGTI